MTKRVTTEDVLRDMRLKHKRERRESDDLHEQSLGFVQRMCDAGLISDVEPTPGAVVPAIIWACAQCGRETDTSKDVLEQCSCGSYVWSQWNHRR